LPNDDDCLLSLTSLNFKCKHLPEEVKRLCSVSLKSEYQANSCYLLFIVIVATQLQCPI